MSCALWLKQLGYEPVIFERSKQLGGELLELDRPNRWVLGMPNMTSVELAERYASHIAQEHIATLLGAQLTAINHAGENDFLVGAKLADGKSASFKLKALVAATGCKAKGPEIFNAIPGFIEAYNAGVISFSPLDHIQRLPELAHKSIAVIGGGDNAHFTAKDLAANGTFCNLLIRSQAKAGKPIRREILEYIKSGQITEFTNAEITGFKLESDGLKILFTADQEVHSIAAGHCFVRAGFTANTSELEGFDVFKKLAKFNGYLQTNSSGQTSEPMVYAAGDVTSPDSQSVVNAIAKGANVAKELSLLL